MMSESENKTLVAVPNLTGDEEWNELVDRLIEEIPEGLPDKVIQATELLLVGYPTNEVAKKLGVNAGTIRSWIKNYPTMALILANGKKMMSKWRMGKMEQQFLTAVQRSQEVLETRFGAEGVNPKILTVVAAQARYIIGLFIGQRQDISVTHELGESVLNAERNALNYLAQKLSEQKDNSDNEPIEAVFRVIDDKVDDSGPMLDSHGNPPHGKLGVLEKNDTGAQCHICGQFHASLAKHLLTKHNMTTENYELLYMLEEGIVRKTDGYW